ncbi:MAG: ImmA/IrrE family metallo-endopeptidase [Candidatus Doudnabacteria bacterium]|nr:ImmA/IrrE family metallo-endopeptidase [Candidatus Doudnabacteria bacterium]
MSQVPSINLDNLKIARENVGLSTLEASKKVTTSKKDVVAGWESGGSLPTWSQIIKIAKTYNVSELLLLSETKIEKNKIIPDYRVGLNGGGGNEKVKKLINTVITRQRWLAEKYREEGWQKNQLQGSGKYIDNPAKLAQFIIDKLELNLEDIKRISGSNSRKETLNYLIHKIENKNIFVGKTFSYNALEVEELRGLFVSHDYCPFIVLNRRDALSAQIFSLIHEVAHLFRKTDSISNSLEFRTTSNHIDAEEVFCNKVAAELLLPKKDFIKTSYNREDIKVISSQYKVSEIFIFYRLLELDKIESNLKQALERQIQADTAKSIKEKEEKHKARESGGNYTNNMKDTNGGLFNRVVGELYLENKISYTEASNALKFNPEAI